MYLHKSALKNTVLGLVLSGLFGLFAGQSFAAVVVGITDYLPFVDVEHNGQTVRIERNQDTENRLDNSFAKTSRPCPPFCVHPMKAAPGVETIGEIELLDFLKTRVNKEEGLLVDSRMPDWNAKGTIPGSVNIPFTILEPNSQHIDAILNLLGAQKDGGNWNFRDSKELMLFCNGPWCDQSPRAIKNLLRLGYPPEKLLYYRAGMQGWQSMGLTIVKP